MNSDYRNILNLAVWISISGSVPWDLLCKWLYVCTFYLPLIQNELKVAMEKFIGGLETSSFFLVHVIGILLILKKKTNKGNICSKQ